MSQFGMQMPGAQAQRKPQMNVYTGLAFLAVICLGAAVAVIPVTRSMERWGRKVVFLFGTLIGTAAALVAATALAREQFGWFCLGAFLSGCSVAVAQQYRFAAIDAAGPLLAGRATSRVLLGGLLSAFLGPELVVWGADLGTGLGLESSYAGHQPFIGAFVLLALICLVAFMLLLAGYRNTNFEEAEHGEASRPLWEILQQPLVWLAILAAAMGYCMMSFVMTATPLSMHTVDGHSLIDTKWVLQSHIIAMFAPSFFSGWLISRLGHRTVIALGSAAYATCLVVAFSGHHLMHYWWALVLLGLGWNFLFVGGTALLPFCHHPSERFKVQMFNEFTVFGTQAVAALSAGWIINAYGWTTLVGLSTVMVVAVLGALAANWSVVRSGRLGSESE